MSPLRLFYLVAAIAGAILPLWHVAPVYAEGGLDALIAGWTANPAAKGLTFDLGIAALVFSVWLIIETWVRRNWIALWALPAAWLIGLSCGLPLFLFLRTRPVA